MAARALNPAGQVEQNRYADSWADHRDDPLEAVIRGNVADFVAADGAVDGVDLGSLLGAWGACP